MLIKEYRIPLPLTVDEYKLGQLYTTAEYSKNETGGGEGVEILENTDFTGVPLLGEKKFASGQYTRKIYYMKSKVPPFIRLLAPKGSLEIHEESWNAYPYCKTVLNNPSYMKDKFEILILSHHLADRGNSENVHELSDILLEQRQVVLIDIGNDTINNKDYKVDEDPALFQSQKTGRGPLTGDWISTTKPMMTCYKLVTVKFKWLGLQNKIEQFVQKSEKRIFTKFHRLVFCSIDKWYGMTMEDLRQMENRIKDELDKERKHSPVKGMVATE